MFTLLMKWHGCVLLYFLALVVNFHRIIINNNMKWNSNIIMERSVEIFLQIILSDVTDDMDQINEKWMNALLFVGRNKHII
jgi:hypothetical protein